MPGMKGLATGIGSLPHRDADAALDLIFKYVSAIPFWPQLPKRDAREGMLAQFSEHIPCVEFINNTLVFNPHKKEQELEVFYERTIAEDLDYFKISPEYSCGIYKFYQRLEQSAPEALKDVHFIKCHVTGPFTFAAGINDENGVSLLHDEVFMQVVVKTIAMKALWQIKMFKKFGKKIILFFDEPYLGCFGSAYTPITKEGVVKVLTELTQTVKTEGVLTGVHCCGNTDWSIFTDTVNLDIINFDAFAFFDRLALYGDNLKGFLDKGGILCWGIVPTNEFDPRHTADTLARKIKEGINILVNKGLRKELLTENLLISPACGLGTLSAGESEKILQKLSETSVCIRKTL